MALFPMPGEMPIRAYLPSFLIGVGRSGDENAFVVVFDFASQHVGKRKGWCKHLSANETNN
jgi:hypothetical protein